MKATAILAASLGFPINRQSRMKPNLQTIYTLQLRGDTTTAKQLMNIRESRQSRYASRATVSQQKRRRAARRRHPHGF